MRVAHAQHGVFMRPTTSFMILGVQLYGRVLTDISSASVVLLGFLLIEGDNAQFEPLSLVTAENLFLRQIGA